jgi:hypothetical protein
MVFVRRTVPFFAVVALAATIATPRASNAQIMDPGCPPHQAVAPVAPDLESALSGSTLRLDYFFVTRTNQIRNAALRWLSNASRSTVSARPARAPLRLRDTR